MNSSKAIIANENNIASVVEYTGHSEEVVRERLAIAARKNVICSIEVRKDY